MYKLSKSRIIIILAICLVGLFFALPNFMPNKDNLPKWWQPVNLGNQTVITVDREVLEPFHSIISY